MKAAFQFQDISVIQTKRVKAFSLMELMVVLTIISILIATGIPSYIRYLQRASLTEAVSVLRNYKTALGVYWNTQGGLPTVGQTLVSTPADLPVGTLVNQNLPDSIQSIELTEEGNGVLINIIVAANIFSSLTNNNRQLSLGAQPFSGGLNDTSGTSTNNELIFVCGNYTTDAKGSSDQGFTDVSVLPSGCNYNGVGTWLSTDPQDTTPNTGPNNPSNQGP